MNRFARPFSLALLIGWGGAHALSLPLIPPAKEAGALPAVQRPWTRWWWPGSAVDEKNLTRQLEQLAAAGFGGVEICPIYGAKGAEERYIDFLSPRWMEVLAHTTREAQRLVLGVDLTTGTGWPFGGPSVSESDASAKLTLKSWTLTAGQRVEEALPRGNAQFLRATLADGTTTNLLDRVKKGRIDWTAPGDCSVDAWVVQSTIMKVKRAAPGGAGWVLDPYQPAALGRYLEGFDRAFHGFAAPRPRAHFHDSFEYFNASWTPALFTEFQARRGYDLRARWDELFGRGDTNRIATLKADLRETFSDLHLDYLRAWVDWTHRQGGLARNQAHGAPANLLDLYAAVDIPEIEIFRHIDERQMPMLKFASSAAHQTGRRLVSAESCTWLGEHFQTTLAEAKRAVDHLFLSGVNHLFYHGVPYSPDDAPWPGWKFYASVDFGPHGGLWRDLPALNTYIARVQTVLQDGEPDPDALLYWPVRDTWHNPEGLLMPFTLHDQEKWLWTSRHYAVATQLWTRGVQYDAVSDRMIQALKPDPAGPVLILPRCAHMPEGTLRHVEALKAGGHRVVEQGQLPPGLAREPLTDHGLRFVRRRSPGSSAQSPQWTYFVVNPGTQPVEAWVPMGRTFKGAFGMRPATDVFREALPVRTGTDGRTEVWLALRPSESLVLASTDEAREGRSLVAATERKPIPVGGTWRVEFLEGGPELPQPFETDTLASWTSRADAEAHRFAGTARYTLLFDFPRRAGQPWWLDLGRVCDSARVTLNGQALGTWWTPPFRGLVGLHLREGRNTLVVEVTNLAANRIADLDRRRVPWKNFHEINFVNIDHQPFDASGWPPRESGLLGPVTLQPVEFQFHPHPSPSP